MKTKKDFITNSSSTSFVFSFPSKIEEIESPIYDLISTFLSIEIYNSIESLKELINCYGLEEDSDEYLDMINIISNGGSLISMEIPTGGEVRYIEHCIEKNGGKMIINND